MRKVQMLALLSLTCFYITQSVTGFRNSESRTISFPVVNEHEHEVTVDVTIIVIQDNVLFENTDSTVIKEERMTLSPREIKNISVVQDTDTTTACEYLLKIDEVSDENNDEEQTYEFAP